MKKKIIAVVLLLCVSLLAFAACGADKEFSTEGMTITLTDQFVEKDVVGQTKVYQSTYVIVTALKEDFTMLPGMEDWTLTYYTNLTLQANHLAAPVIQTQTYYYFTYEKTVSGQEYFYLATTHKASDAFWLIQFACFKKDKDTYLPKFIKWADSVVFDAQA